MADAKVALQRNGHSHVDGSGEADLVEGIGHVKDDMTGGVAGEVAVPEDGAVTDEEHQVEAGEGQQQSVEDMFPQLAAADDDDGDDVAGDADDSGGGRCHPADPEELPLSASCQDVTVGAVTGSHGRVGLAVGRALRYRPMTESLGQYYKNVQI